MLFDLISWPLDGPMFLADSTQGQSIFGSLKLAAGPWQAVKPIPDPNLIPTTYCTLLGLAICGNVWWVNIVVLSKKG